MSKINNFKEFIKESLNDNSDLETYKELRDKLAEVLKEEISNSSFSSLAIRDNDPEQDYLNTLDEIINYTGITNNMILILFSDKVNNLLNQTFYEFVESNYLNEVNGEVDLYIYKTCELLGLDKNRFTLGGDGWGEYMLEDSDEALIRYNYGYHKTKYGKLMLQQLNISDSEFKTMAEYGLKDDLINNTWFIILNKFKIYKLKNNYVFDQIINELSVHDYVIFDDDDKITFLTFKLAEDLSKLLNNDDITTELVNSVLTDIYDNWDIQSIDNEFIIYIDM